MARITVYPAGGSSAGGGTVTGSGAANRVAYWDGASSITSDAAFTYDGTTLGLRLAIKGNEAGTAAAQVVYFNEIADGSQAFSGGSGLSNGGNGVFYGGSHATKPSFMEFRQGSTVVLDCGASGQWTLGQSGASTTQRVAGNAITIISSASTTNVEILRSVTTGSLSLEGGTGNAAGTVTLYGSTHATKASYIEFINTNGIGGVFDTALNFAVGTGTDAATRFLVSGGAGLTGTTQNGIYNFVQFNSACTTQGYGVLSQPRVADASFTMARLAGIMADIPTLAGSSNAVTRFANIVVQDASAVARVTNTACLTDTLAFTAGNWFIRQNGTLASSFAGTVNVANLVTTTGVSMAADGVGNIGVGAADAVGTDRALGIGAKRIIRLGGSAYWLDTGTAQTTMVLNTTGWRFATDTGNIYMADGSGNLVQFLMTDGSILSLGAGAQMRTPYSTAAKPGFSSNSNNTSGLAITSANNALISTNGTARLTFDSTGNVVVGTAAIATSATDGFLYIPTCAGAATGTVTTYTGRAAMVADTTNLKIWVNFAGTWKSIVLI